MGQKHSLSQNSIQSGDKQVDEQTKNVKLGIKKTSVDGEMKFFKFIDKTAANDDNNQSAESNGSTKTNKFGEAGGEQDTSKFINSTNYGYANSISLIYPIRHKEGKTKEITYKALRDDKFKKDETLDQLRFLDRVKGNIKYNEAPDNGEKTQAHNKSWHNAIFARKRFDEAHDSKDIVDVKRFYEDVTKFQRQQYSKKMNAKVFLYKDEMLQCKWLPDIYLKVEEIKVYLFATGIGFIIFVLSIIDKGDTYFVENDIYELYSAINRIYPFRESARIFIDEQCKHILEFYDVIGKNIIYEDEYHGYESSIFSSLFISSKQDVRCSKIPLWFSGKSETKTVSILEEAEYLGDNLIVEASAHGCCVLAYVDVKDKNMQRYYNKSVFRIWHHSLIIYLIALHHRYYLDDFYQDEECAEEEKKPRSVQAAESTIRKFICLRKYYSFGTLSMVYKYQKMYVSILRGLNIENIENFVYTYKEMARNFVERKSERLYKVVMILLGILSAGTLIISIINLLI